MVVVGANVVDVVDVVVVGSVMRGALVSFDGIGSMVDEDDVGPAALGASTPK